jgi:hypothetical protein
MADPKSKNNYLIKKLELEDIERFIPLQNWQNTEDLFKQRIVVEGQTNNHTIRLLGLKSKDFISDPVLFIKAQFLVSAYYNFDKPCNDYDFYNIEAEALGQEMIYREGFLPEINITKPLLEEKKTLYSLKPNISKNKARFGFVIGLNKLFKSILGFTPRIRFCGPFSLAVSLRGYQSLIADMEDDKKYVMDLFNFLNHEVILPWVNIQKDELGDDNITAGGIEATATMPNVSIKILNDWVIPSFETLKQKIGNLTLTTFCGGLSYFKNIDDFFFYQLKTCPGIIKGYQWDIEKNGFKVFNDYAKKNDLALRLGISAQTLLYYNLREILDLIKRYVFEGGNDLKKYSIYLSDIDPLTSFNVIKFVVEKIKALSQKNKESLDNLNNISALYESFDSWLLSIY